MLEDLLDESTERGAIRSAAGRRWSTVSSLVARGGGNGDDMPFKNRPGQVIHDSGLTD